MQSLDPVCPLRDLTKCGSAAEFVGLDQFSRLKLGGNVVPPSVFVSSAPVKGANLRTGNGEHF
jgi:hypothetical protein